MLEIFPQMFCKGPDKAIGTFGAAVAAGQGGLSLRLLVGMVQG
jgi:hypothetical protein